jgi:hypothetical protein
MPLAAVPICRFCVEVGWTTKGSDAINLSFALMLQRDAITAVVSPCAAVQLYWPAALA